MVIFSTVYTSFNPVEEFERLGIEVDAEVDGGRLSAREAYAWRPFQGTLVLPHDKAGCEIVTQAIRRALEQALGGSAEDELYLSRQRVRGRPFYGTLRYTQERMKGHVYVWLFPDESETKICYAILVRERQASGSVATVNTASARSLSCD